MVPQNARDLLEPIVAAQPQQWAKEVNRYLDNPADLADFTRAVVETALIEPDLIHTLHQLGHLDAQAFKYVREEQPGPADPDLKTVSARLMAALADYIRHALPDRREEIFKQAAVCHHYDDPRDLAHLIVHVLLDAPEYLQAIVRGIKDGQIPDVSPDRLRELTFNNLYQVVQADETFVERLLDVDSGDIHPATIALAIAINVAVEPELGLEGTGVALSPLAAFYFATLPAQERPINPQSREALELIWKLIDENPDGPDQLPDRADTDQLSPLLAGLLDAVDAQLPTADAYLRAILPLQADSPWGPFGELIGAIGFAFDLDDEPMLIEMIEDHLAFWNLHASPKTIRKALLAPHSAFITRYLVERLGLAAYFPPRLLDVDHLFDHITLAHLILLLVTFEPPSSRTKAAAFPRWLWSQFRTPVALSKADKRFIRHANYVRIMAIRCPTFRALLRPLVALPAKAGTHPVTPFGDLPISSLNIGKVYSALSETVAASLRTEPDLAHGFDMALSPQESVLLDPPLIFHLYRQGVVSLVHFAESLYQSNPNPIAMLCELRTETTRQDLAENGPYQTVDERTDTYYYFNNPHQAALFNWLLRTPDNYVHFLWISTLIPPLADLHGRISAMLLAQSLPLRSYRGILPPPEEIAEVILVLRSVEMDSDFLDEAHDFLVNVSEAYVPDQHFAHFLDLAEVEDDFDEDKDE